MSSKAPNPVIENTYNNQNNQQVDKLWEIESESECDESESSDSGESIQNDGADDPHKGCGNNDENRTQQQSHCIQVVLQNGRLINVNTERPTENEVHMQEMRNGLRCVIVNDRGN